jgi:hypothetical protein
MLRIPGPDDRPPPLMVTRKPQPQEPQQTPAAPQGEVRRRKKRSRSAEGHSWDSSPGKHRRSRGEDKKQMVWMMIGGVTLFAVIIGGVWMAMRGGDASGSAGSGVAPARPDVVEAPPAVPAEVPEKSDVAIAAEIEPLIRKFLEATSIEEILPLVRDPATAKPRMRRTYPDGKVAAPGMAEFNTREEIVRVGSIVSVNVRTKEYEEKSIACIQTPDGFKIDWESWAGWSDLSWEDFMAAKPTESKQFRVSLSEISYYNAAFSDELKWQSYRLISPDGKHTIYGYVERGSVIDARLKLPPDTKSSPLILKLGFPENATTSNQVMIRELVSEGWVLQDENKP